jgi:predicted AAA+ superfamily ATPase
VLKTVRDACTPHKMALDFSMAEQIEDLAAVIGGAGDGQAFFAKNHITAGMRQLFDLGLRRLAGRSDQAVFELTQAMGGGKTHTMIAFGLVARNAKLRESVVPEFAASSSFGGAKIVAFSGRQYPDHFLWGEIASQLGKPEAFRRYWQDGASAPDERAWLELIGEDPTVILLDELPPYFDYAVTRSVGAGTLAQVATAALSNLFSAALKLPRLCIVVSNLSGSYEGASKDLRRAIKNVEQEAKRQAKPITPVELGGDEIYQILKKRLFEKLPNERDVEDVVQAYATAIKEAEKSKAIAKSTEQIADEIRGSYPFHPSIKDLIALFRNNEGYRQTRGLMQFVIEDDWIENIEELDERISEFIEKKKRANAFDIRYSDTVDPTGQPWEKCSQVLSRKDVVERLSRGW